MDSVVLAKIIKIPQARAEKWAAPLTVAMLAGQINTRLRICAFLAQIGHESASLFYVKELGNDEYFAKYGKGKLAEQLGNTLPGDASKFCGRGLIQVTGRSNYAQCSVDMFGDKRLLDHPQTLEEPEWAAKSAVWFWNKRNLNALADAQDFEAITKKINDGTNGAEDRQERYKLALSVLA